MKDVSYILFHIIIPICFFRSVEKFLNKVFDICLASIKQSQNDWLIKTNSSPIGEFTFILNTDWQRNNWMLINHFNKSKH